MSGLVPKLRFPEFQKTPAWEERQVADIALSEASSLSLGRLELQSSGYPVFGADGIAGYVDHFDQDSSYIAIVKDGAGVGRLRYCPPGSSTLSTLSYLKVRDEAQVSIEWLYYLLHTINIPQYSKGSGIPHVYFSDYSKHRIGKPTLAEQRKIAECLTSLDELIAAERRGLEALRKWKKALLQNLFPREGETTPRLRFPEFRHAGEWRETSLGSIADLKSGYAFRSSEYIDSPEFRIVTIANVQVGQLALEDMKGICQLPGDLQDHQLLKIGDILISMTGNVGRVCRVCTGKLLLNQRVGKLVPRSVVADFLYHLLQREEFRSGMQLSAAGGAQGNLSSGSITGFRTSVPKEESEQHRIASCLSSLDTLITEQSKNLDTLETHKLGLMQQLFPVTV